MKPDAVLRPEFIYQFKQPAVYVWRRGSNILYVGMSIKSVLHRISTHDTVDVVEPLQQDDAVEVHFCDSATDARELEGFLLVKHSPKYNSVSPQAHGYANRWQARKNHNN